ncbi:hypothetical protein [Streptomyces brasiliscabiei]|uniref:hypothetical protein n=1 Tax=Streptomyces brasiliscabiei TaxID=2736302 RepID=UPI001C113986|nr:hypothetical protein [Streptomyces brasiliscabiei]
MTKSETTEPANPYELLANYLEPRFGNIYEYNVQDAGFDAQEWTDELREAVLHYLEHELPEAVVAVFFEYQAGAMEDPTSKHAAIDRLMQSNEPWELAHDVRRAAVKAAPTLDALIGHLDTWPSEDERADAEEWLEHHASNEVLRSMAPGFRA